MAKILAPNKRYTGISASVAFANGVGKTEDKHLIEWFKEHGYEIVEEKQEVEETMDEKPIKVKEDKPKKGKKSTEK